MAPAEIRIPLPPRRCFAHSISVRPVRGMPLDQQLYIVSTTHADGRREACTRKGGDPHQHGAEAAERAGAGARVCVLGLPITEVS